jgi:hypothetical protein
MATTASSNATSAQQLGLEKSPFEKQRDLLIGQVTQVCILPISPTLKFKEHGTNHYEYESSQSLCRRRHSCTNPPPARMFDYLRRSEKNLRAYLRYGGHSMKSWRKVKNYRRKTKLWKPTNESVTVESKERREGMVTMMFILSKVPLSRATL